MKSLLTSLLLVEILLLGTCKVSLAEGLFETKDVYVAGQDAIREYRIPALVTTRARCDHRLFLRDSSSLRPRRCHRGEAGGVGISRGRLRLDPMSSRAS